MKVRVIVTTPFAIGDEAAGTLRRFAGGKTYLVDVDDARALTKGEPCPVSFASVQVDEDEDEDDGLALLKDLRAALPTSES